MRYSVYICTEICAPCCCCAACRYVGFDMIANAAEEAKNPRRDVPLATALCLGLCTALYAAASTVITGERPAAFRVPFMACN
jgi:amino acid transporter